MKVEIIYKITSEDVQEVALREIGRELTHEEIKSITDAISDNIKWYDAVADAINANIKSDDQL